jgi:two-component system cell cycle response regulator DivK
MKILYVEDNPANLYLVKRIAKAGQHEVINYIDGEEALNDFETLKPDLVLLDIQLAGELSGLDVVRELRKRGYDTYVVAVTAYAMVGDKERCLAAGCDDYMAKPLPIQRLVTLFNHPISEVESKRTDEFAKVTVEDNTSLPDVLLDEAVADIPLTTDASQNEDKTQKSTTTSESTNITTGDEASESKSTDATQGAKESDTKESDTKTLQTPKDDESDTKQVATPTHKDDKKQDDQPTSSDEPTETTAKT